MRKVALTSGRPRGQQVSLATANRCGEWREAIQQRDAADEGRLEASGSALIGALIVIEGEVVRPSQLIASVRRTLAR